MTATELQRLVGRLEHEHDRAVNEAERLGGLYQLASAMLGQGNWVDVGLLTREEHLIDGRYFFVRRVWGKGQGKREPDPPCLAEWNDGWRVHFGRLTQTHATNASIEVWQ